MLRSRLFWRLYVGFVALILFCSTAIGLLVAAQIEAEVTDSTRRSLRAQSRLLRDLSMPVLDASRPQPGDLREPGSTSLLQEQVRALGSDTETRYTVVDDNGAVLADSERDPATMDNHGDRPEVRQARTQGSGVATRFSETIGIDMMYVAVPVGPASRPLGYVRTSLPMGVLQDQLTHLKTIVLTAAAVAAAVALALGFVLVRRTVRPLTEMRAFAQAVASGDYDRRLDLRGTDEVAQLAVALDEIAASSRERVATITRDRNRMLAILTSMIEGVVAVDVERRVLHMNRAALRILGVRANSVDRDLADVVEVEEVDKVLRDTLRDEIQQRSEFRRAGQPRDQFVDLHSAPLRDGNGVLVGAVVVMHDLSELRQLEAVRRDFVANVSHELKTPITAIRGLVETLLDAPEMQGEQRERFLGKISDQAMRLSTLVADLLTLSRLESDDSVRNRQLLDLRHPVGAAATALQTVAEAGGIRLTATVPERPVQVWGDVEALRQMTSNLLDNAIKYTPRRGQIDVSLQVIDDRAILEVRDTGIGIAPKHRDRIFQRFYRVDKARSREVGGTGLGLSIVKHVALSHGGLVSLDSAVEKGSTFRVEIPLANSPAAVVSGDAGIRTS